MNSTRSAERTKSLKIEPVSEDLVCFESTLIDHSEGPDGSDLIHSLSIKGTISLPDLTIRSIEATALHQPYPECAASLDPVRQLVGLRIRSGYSNRVRELLGGTAGCSHFLALALDLGASHTLTTYLRVREKVQSSQINQQNSKWMRAALVIEPRLENACIALQSESRPVKQAKQGQG